MDASLNRHRRRLAGVSPELRSHVLWYFKIPPVRDHLADVLGWYGLWQADLVLCLLRSPTREARRLVGTLIGHPITVCPPCLSGSRRRLPVKLFVDGERRVTWVGKNLFAETSDMYRRFGMLRPGMLESEFKARGGRRKDLRVALRRGLIKMEKAA